MSTHATQNKPKSNPAEEKVRVRASSKRDDATKAAVEEIWSESSTRLGQFIRARVADPATAQDILHDVFLKFQSRLNEFHDPAKVQGWLFLVARNAVIDHYRTRKPTSELTESLPAELPRIPVNEMEELHVVFRQIMDRLPEPYRQALVLTAFEGFPQEELARRLGISLSAAKSRVQRGREQLKEMLLDFCEREFSHTPGSSPCPYGLVHPVTASKRVLRKTPATRPSKSKQLR
jgi:RNA polymerase sigma-70 factor (ECF subfamily)